MILLLLGAAVLLITAYLAALNLALARVSESALAERLEESGRTSSALWLLPRRHVLAQGVALLRTFGRMGFFAVVLAAIAGLGTDSTLAVQDLVVAIVAAALPLWLVTSVIAGALAEHAALGLIVRGMPLLWLLQGVALPLSWIVRALDEAVRRLTGANVRSSAGSGELLRTIEESQRQGEIDPEAATLLENVVEFTGTAVSEVMTPRTEVQGLEYTDDLSVIRAEIAEGGHSRIPVFRESLDDIAGILYVKDLMGYLGEAVREFRLQPLLRQPIRVPETKRVAELLKDFQRSEVHMALVIDEYGGTSGLVTIEDVLEEIVGEIRDEHEPVDEADPELVAVGDGTAIVDGRVRVNEVNAALGLELPEDESFDTVAGLLLAEFGRVPASGESLESFGARFTILEATPTQIMKVRVEASRPVASAP
jgi:CBS domain containing-hemolysin-like protein